ncbi:hypothetical protein DRW07_14515 [Alteromonas sediminis]|uniref:Tetratricopeptide repeat protein n=1 Tax=Alteromonas sediminis TaxID=2259342 RepID=A0A3N5Y0I9_9ALTE|nr:hypothetical protein [Alteromonas sediminis]RPJ66016.1 hypothetical protein DRW07_14515 [Alteromonas sediminis]
MKRCVQVLLFIVIAIATPAKASEPNSAMQLFKQEKYQAVIDILLSKPDKSLNDYRLLINAQLKIDLDDAEESAESMKSAYQDDFRSHLTYASVMGAQASDSIFSALGYAKKAKGSLIKAVELDNTNPAALNALFSFHLAAPSIAGGDKEEARRLVQRIKAVDVIEGELAQARYLLSEENTEGAKAILVALSQQPNSALRANMQLGHRYVSEENFGKAIEAYRLAASAELAAPNEHADDQIKTRYAEWQQTKLFAHYRIGWVAVESKTHLEEGVASLRAYIMAYQQAEQVFNLPSLSWAKIRLTELLLELEQFQEAKVLFSTINELDESDFKKHVRRLKKRLRNT